MRICLENSDELSVYLGKQSFRMKMTPISDFSQIEKNLLEIAGERYLQKIYPTEDWLPKERRFVSHLVRKGFPIQECIVPDDDILHFRGRPCLLFRYISGETEHRLKEGILEGLGTLVANFHIESTVYLDKPENSSVGIVHGDLRQENIIVAKGNINLIDLDNAHEDFFYKDVGSMLLYIVEKELARKRDSNVMRSLCFLSSYQRTRQLSTEDIKQLPQVIISKCEDASTWSNDQYSKGLLSDEKLERTMRLMEKARMIAESIVDDV